MNTKTMIITAVIILIIVGLFTFLATTRSVAGLSVMPAKEFLLAYNQTTDAVLLDVRTPSEYASGHIEGAINLDFQDPSFASSVAKLDTTKPYFVYCRSGNRSGQAISFMKNVGISTIYELRGGLSASGSVVNLVTTTVNTATTSEYVVDVSDMVNGQALVQGISKSTLIAQEIAGLVQMREEEKLARDVYTTLGNVWGTKVFSNIASSEQTHTDAIKVLLDRYEIADPVKNNPIGVFTSPTMQKLYNDLTTEGKKSLKDALIVGATIEDLDIYDLDVLMKQTTKQDILVTYTNLQKGSRNHMRAFVKNLGGSYTPKYITQEAYTAIIASSQERGRQ